MHGEHPVSVMSGNKRNRSVAQALAVVMPVAFSMALSCTAHAQEATKSTQGAVLEEIVVTATRRSESLQDVAIAATAIPGSQLASKAVERMSDLQFAAPSLTITTVGLVDSVNIRGIGLASGSPQVANGVATYFDGLFQPPIVTTNTFYDIASVEVLRGPQGTLAGSNSTGGAIFITSNSPKLYETGGHVQVEGGNYNSRGAQAAVNLPLGDTFAMRFAGNYQKRDSYYTDIGPFHNDAGSLDEKSGRIGLLWNPGIYKATLKVEDSYKTTGGYARRPIPGTPLAPFAAPGGPFTLDFNTLTENKEHGLLASLEQRIELDSGLVFRWVSGWQDKRVHNLDDTDATEAQNVFFDQSVQERQHSEEINIISPTTGSFSWVVGGYFQRNLINVDIVSLAGTLPLNVEPRNDKKTIGVFAQTNFALTDRFELQVGGRYSHFKSTGTGGVFVGRGLPFPPFNLDPKGLQVADTNGDHSDGRLTGKVDLNFKLDANNLFYAFAARGAKPGGFNSSTSEFGPEGVWDYEAGWKSTLADGHVRTQLGGFYYKYSDFQLDLVDTASGQTNVTNLPDATIKGLEAQVQAVFGGLRFDAGAAYVKSKMSAITFVGPLPAGGGGVPQCPPGVTTACYDYSPYIQTNTGGPNLFSPEFTYNVGAEYAVPVAAYTLTPRLNYAYVGSAFTSLTYSAINKIPAHGLLSALATFDAKPWSVQAYGTNLTNKEYVAGQSGLNEFFGPPREYGLRVTFDF